MKRVHYAWVVNICAMLCMFCNVGLGSSAFAVYQPYLIEVAGLTNSQSSALIMIRSLFSLLAMSVVGFYSRKLGVRLAVTLAVCGSAAAFFVYATADSFPVYCAAAALNGTFYTLGGIVPSSLLVERWFETHRGIAFGICATGTSIASIFMPPLCTWLIERYSLHVTFLLETGLLLFLAVVLFLLVRGDPASVGLEPLGHGETAAIEQTSHGRSLSRGNLALMCLAMVMLGTIGNTGFSHLGVLFSSEGFPAGKVSFFLSLLGVMLSVSKCLYGQTVDRIGAYRTGYLFFGTTAAGVALCTIPGLGGMAGAVAAILLQGTGLALCSVGLSVFAGDLAPRDQYGKTIRRFQTSYTCGAILFGSCPGILADLTGSYRPAYLILTVFAFLAAIIVQGTYHRVLAREAAQG